MADGRRLWFAFVVCVLWQIGSAAHGSSLRREDFRERLVLRPLPDGKVLGHFQFVNELEKGPGEGDGHHHKLFPKAIFQIVHKFRIQEMELSFTQGRWEHRRWGELDGMDESTNTADVKPGGVELWAQFRQSNDDDNDVDMLWRNLTHALSGLFCASINFLEDPAMVSTSGGARQFDTGDAVRQGALPRETVCTENLTPWLKLLPCRDRAGLSTLLERPRIHNGYYYSLRVHVTAGNAIDRPRGSLTLTQTLTLVLNPSDTARRALHNENPQPNWSLSSLFGRPLLGSCPLATASHIQIELEANLVEELKKSQPRSTEAFDVNLIKAVHLSWPPQTVSSKRNSASQSPPSLFLNYDVQNYSQSSLLDVGMSWRAFITWSPRQSPFRATQFLTGRGNGRGAIVSVINANGDTGNAGSVDVTTFQIVPWYVRLYMHTLKVMVDGQHVKGVRLKLSPADDRKSPAVLEIGVTVPRNATVVLMSVEFDKGYLRIDEHPPDANRGFDLPSALFTFRGSAKGLGLGLHPFQIYSDNLLVLLATPDFSMPYNVITFVMTALALYFGSLLNSLRMRSLPELPLEQQPASRLAAKLQKLLARLSGRTGNPKLKTL